MRLINLKAARARFSDDFGAQRAAVPENGFVDAKFLSGLVGGGIGNLAAPGLLQPLLITTDTVPDAPDTAGSTNPVLTVTGPGVTTPIISAIDTIGDQDFYKLTLTAGTTYEIGLYSYNGGPNVIGVTDPLLELYAADGTTLITTADGGADTPYNELNSGFDSLLVYTPTTSGTYYINARAFSNTPLTPTGDSVGDYQLFAREQDPNDPSIYRPYYEPDSPLYAIDWGSQVNRVNQSARNPDGNEGTRDTGNAQGTPIYGTALNIPALAASGSARPDGNPIDISGKNIITIYFAKVGDLITSIEDPTSPGLPPVTLTVANIQDFEYDAVWTALAQFEKVADVIYLEVQDRSQADFTYTSYAGTPGPVVSLLGSMSPPDEPDEGLAQFNNADYRWNALDLGQGGFSFVTLIHEFGHGHGLAHPHDNGGRSGIMNGVTSNGPVADYTLGDYSLNQAVLTMMSYQDGWPESPYGNAPTDVGYGYLGGLMAFDIAAIQDKYGVNEDTATGNDTYTLKDVNDVGTYYTSIWDGGGTDQIVYGGGKDATIDLRAATLQYEEGGGGRVSFAFGIFGGFTIANSVVIENATTGSGNDTLHDNGADNVLNGGAGNDILHFNGGGDDTAIGGDGNDAIIFGSRLSQGDVVDAGAGNDQLGLQGNYAGYVFGADNLGGVESLVLISGEDDRFGNQGGSAAYSYDLTVVDANAAAGQQLKVLANALNAGENFTFNGSAETNGTFLIFGGQGVDTLTGGSGDDAFLFGTEGRFGAADAVNGGAGTSDQLGLSGDYSSGIIFAADTMVNIEGLVFISSSDSRYGTASGGSYDVTLHDGNVAEGQTLLVTGAQLLATEAMRVDGSRESDGAFRMLGGQAGDTLIGGAGNDFIYGGLGADVLTGNGGADTFHYRGAAQSTSLGFDQILDFDFSEDRIELLSGVVDFGRETFATLREDSFDDDIAAAVANSLGAGETMLVNGVDGDYAGRMFAIVDANGVFGYQAGEDYVFEFVQPPAILFNDIP